MTVTMSRICLFLFIADNGSIRVIGQDDCEIYSVENDTAFVRTRQYLMDGNSSVPFPLAICTGCLYDRS